MANTTLQLLVDDSSPTLQFYPFADTLGVPDLLSGWNPYYTETGFATTLGEQGNGTSLHITSLEGAVFSIPFFGTGLQLFGNVTLSATYDLSLDGKTVFSSIPSFNASDPSLLASFPALAPGNHTLTLVVHNPTKSNSSLIAIDRAVIFENEPAALGLTTKIVEDTELPFVGEWTFDRETGLSSSDTTFHTSTNAGDRFTFLFNQSVALSLLGFRDISSGKYAVLFDDQPFSFNGQSSFKETATLFYISGLNASMHNMTVINLEDHLLAIGSINLTTVAQPASLPLAATHSTLSGGTIAAVVVASFLGLCTIGLSAYVIRSYFFAAKRRRPSVVATSDVLDSVVLDSAVLDIGPSDVPEQKPPSKSSSGQRDGSNHSRSFTLSLPIQSRPSHSQRELSSNSVQQLPRSPSISLVGAPVPAPPGTEASANGQSTQDDPYLDVPESGSPFTLEFASRTFLERSSFVPQSDRNADASVVDDRLIASLPTSPIDSVAVAAFERRPRRTLTTDPVAARAAHQSFLDISSRDGSVRDGHNSSDYTSSSGSARRRRLSEQTVSTQARPVSLNYAFQYHRGTDLGLFRQAELQSSLETAPPVPPLPSVLPSVLPSTTSASLAPPSASPTSPLRPLPRIPQSIGLLTRPPSPVIESEGAPAPRVPPALHLRTQFDDAPAGPSAAAAAAAAPHEPRAHRRRPFSAIASTEYSSLFSSRRDSGLLQAPPHGRARQPSAASVVSPTESVPMTVSDIHFRSMSDDEGDAAADRPALPPLQTTRQFASPFIMNKLLGGQATLGLPGDRPASAVDDQSSSAVAGPSRTS